MEDKVNEYQQWLMDKIEFCRKKRQSFKSGAFKEALREFEKVFKIGE